MKLKHHILVVDDDPFLQEFLCPELAEHGYLPFSAKNGLEALDIIAAIKMSAVITDIFMPEMDGIELIKNLRSHDPNVPIFALSGGTRVSNSDVYLGFAKRLGANEIFAKPVEATMLITKLNEYFQRGTEKLV